MAIPMSDDVTHEYDCIDCGCPVVRFGHWPDLVAKRCAGCEFLTWIPDETKRAEMRALMLERGAIGPPQ